MAAGIYGHLKDIVLSHVQQEPTPDLSPDTLNALCSLMVAQAQEAIYRKAAAGIVQWQMWFRYYGEPLFNLS